MFTLLYKKIKENAPFYFRNSSITYFYEFTQHKKLIYCKIILFFVNTITYVPKIPSIDHMSFQQLSLNHPEVVHYE
jgi:hypothetical protein